ncbi:MAG: hypothetical protein IPK08_06215 [Bacteroidetes bacterium]|nr:hypothetical protein [Bacteroidota bacterium]
MQRVEILITNKKLLKAVTEQGFSSLNLFTFFLILKSHSETGLIQNFSTTFTKHLMTDYNFSRNTIKERVNKLQRLGYAMYNSKLNVLHLTSVNFLKLKYGIKISNNNFVRIKLETKNHKAVTAQLRAVASDIYFTNKIKSYKIQQRCKNGSGNSAKGSNLQMQNFITSITRKELAGVIGSKHSSTGQRLMKRLKQFNLVKEDTQQANYIKECTFIEFIHCYAKTDVNPNAHYFYKYGKVYEQLANRVQFKNYQPHVTDLMF